MPSGYRYSGLENATSFFDLTVTGLVINVHEFTVESILLHVYDRYGTRDRYGIGRCWRPVPNGASKRNRRKRGQEAKRADDDAARKPAAGTGEIGHSGVGIDCVVCASLSSRGPPMAL
jgi:hypothetical protein